ncbi:hypothetical protein [Streptomyces sp. NPDC057689]|uniref:hypothetical protein n=1 Tax=Streptomyces sp. NPDC057689 TaxID=3346213 RepID=UPI003695FF1A
MTPAHPVEDDGRPIPPPFMWACAECSIWLLRLARKWTSSDEWDGVTDDDGCLTEQLALAAHIAGAHPEDVPPQHLDDCELCPHYAKDPDHAGRVWAEHRARGHFMPPSHARLL